jgi:hypothetical protein
MTIVNYNTEGQDSMSLRHFRPCFIFAIRQDSTLEQPDTNLDHKVGLLQLRIVDKDKGVSQVINTLAYYTDLTIILEVVVPYLNEINLKRSLHSTVRHTLSRILIVKSS